MKTIGENLKLLLAVGVLLLLLILCLQPSIINSFWRQTQDNTVLTEAMYYAKLPGKRVQCLLCPRRCILKDGERGFCNVRVNRGGKLYSLVYGRAVLNVFPARCRSLIYCATDYNMLRIGTFGCPMRCKFCLTWNMSQGRPEDIQVVPLPGMNALNGVARFTPEGLLSPEQIIQYAKKDNCRIIIYTLNEPIVFYEYMLAIAKLARKEGLINILSTCGYINKEPLEELLEYIDGVSLGLKGFTEEFYRKYCFAELKPVLETLKALRDSGIGFEITYPVIPSANDDPDQIRKMCMWIKENLGSEVPLHFYRYVPSYRLANLPPTPLPLLHAARKIARDAGLKYVYIYYNVNEAAPGVEEKIDCPNCNQLILHRTKERALIVNNTEKGRCKFCGQKILFVVID